MARSAYLSKGRYNKVRRFRRFTRWPPNCIGRMGSRTAAATRAVPAVATTESVDRGRVSMRRRRTGALGERLRGTGARSIQAARPSIFRGDVGGPGHDSRLRPRRRFVVHRGFPDGVHHRGSLARGSGSVLGDRVHRTIRRSAGGDRPFRRRPRPTPSAGGAEMTNPLYRDDGSIPGNVATAICVRCAATGEVWVEREDGRARADCPRCNGRGYVPFAEAARDRSLRDAPGASRPAPRSRD